MNKRQVEVEAAHQLAPADSSEPMPYLPIVNAIAPKAPIGATLHDEADDDEERVGYLLDEVGPASRPRSPAEASAEAEQHREQQHLQDLALGERVDDGGGMTFIRKSTVLCDLAAVV